MNNPTPDPKGYETMYIRFLTLRKVSPYLAHEDHKPKPSRFGLSEKEAAFIRVRAEREHGRSF